MQDVSRAIEIEAEQAKRILAAVHETIADDEQAVVDTVEGQTNLLEAIDAGLARLGEIDAVMIGIKAHIEGLRARIERFEKSEERIRDVLFAAMQTIGTKRIERSLGTLLLQKKPQAVIEYNLGLVPDVYWIPQPPKLDKKKASADLKAGQAIPGLGLTDPSVTLHIR